MNAITSRDPFLILKEIEQRSLQHAQGLPQQPQVQRLWSGIGVRLGKTRLLIPVDQVNEMIRSPRLTRVPGVKNWVRGVTNIRGNLLPVIDLSAALGGAVGGHSSKARVLIMERPELSAGLLVDEVLGLRQFFEENRQETPSDIDGFPGMIFDGVFQQNDESWGVITAGRLAKYPDFMQVALH